MVIYDAKAPIIMIFNLKVSLPYISVTITASQRMISFLLRRLGTNTLNQESELSCPGPVCHDPGDGGSLAGPGEASVNLDRGMADDIPLKQCNAYSVLEGVLGRCGVA
jgi:hypothetical protein